MSWLNKLPIGGDKTNSVSLLREELMATEGVSSLYERLGGVYSIATVIESTHA